MLSMITLRSTSAYCSSTCQGSFHCFDFTSSQKESNSDSNSLDLSFPSLLYSPPGPCSSHSLVCTITTILLSLLQILFISNSYKYALQVSVLSILIIKVISILLFISHLSSRVYLLTCLELQLLCSTPIMLGYCVTPS